MQPLGLVSAMAFCLPESLRRTSFTKRQREYADERILG